MTDVHQSLRLLPNHRSEWPNEPPGDSLLRRHYSSTFDVESDQDIDELEDQLKEAGPQERFFEQPFAGLPDRTCFTQRSSIKHYGTNPPTKFSDTSATQVIIRSALGALSDSCPSLDSDHGDSSDGTEDGDTVAALQASSTACTSSKRSIQQHDPSIFASIRQVLSSKPSFAEAVISKIQHLPPCKRKLLLGEDATSNTECTDGSSSQSSHSSDRPSKRLRTNNNSNKKRGEKPPAGDRVPGDDGDVGDGNRGGDKGKSPSSQQKEKKKRRWYCPYDLAYPNIREKGSHFKHCSTGNMTERYQWREHLEKHHSEEAKANDKNSDENAKFYMDETTLKAVLKQIKLHDRRPRGEGEEYGTSLFITVWDIIFPPKNSSNFPKPLSAFHPEGSDTQSLEQYLANRAQILVGLMYDARADEAGAMGFQPTPTDTKAFISASIAVILHNSPSATATTHWLAHAPPDTIRSAGQHYMAQSAGHSVTTPYEEEVETEADGPTTPPTTVAETPQLVSQAPMMPEPTFPTGTHFEAPLFPNRMQTDTQMGYPTIPPAVPEMNTPAGPCMDFPMMNQGPYDPTPFSMISPDPYNPTPFPMMNPGQYNPISFPMMNPGPYTPIPFPQANTVLPQQFNRDNTARRGGQGVPPQAIQSQPVVAQHYGFYR